MDKPRVFIQDFLLGVENVDVCNRHMYVLVHYGINEIFDILKNFRIQPNNYKWSLK